MRKEAHGRQGSFMELLLELHHPHGSVQVDSLLVVNFRVMLLLLKH